MISTEEIDISTEQAIWTTSRPAYQAGGGVPFVGAVIEFDVADATELTIRFVVSLQAGAWGNFAAAPVDFRNNYPELPPGSEYPSHIRGYWKHSLLRLGLPEFDSNPQLPPPYIVERDFCDQDGTEGSYFSQVNSLAVDSTLGGNRAAYGAILEYSGNSTNSNQAENGTVKLGIRSRNTGGRYYGAGNIVLPLPSWPRKLPPIPSPNTDSLRGYDLTNEYPMPVPFGYIGVPPNTAAPGIPVTIRLANGGGCATPANIMINRSGVWPFNAEDPGEE